MQHIRTIRIHDKRVDRSVRGDDLVQPSVDGCPSRVAVGFGQAATEVGPGMATRRGEASAQESQKPATDRYEFVHDQLEAPWAMSRLPVIVIGGCPSLAQSLPSGRQEKPTPVPTRLLS